MPGATHGWETDAQILAPGSRLADSLDDNDDEDVRLVTHRSTALARLPATWLGMRADMFLLRLLMLPVESAAMRKVAGFYISSGMPFARGVVGTTGINQMASTTIPGLWSLITGRAGRENFGVVMRRLSQLGLSVALTVGVEVVLFGVVYALARRDGIAQFGWKRLHREGTEGVVEEDIGDDEDDGRAVVPRN
jgi:hypothetical protein